MPVAFKDFFPEVKKHGFFANEYATVTETVARANEWLSGRGVRVLNVETILLPNIGGAKDTEQVLVRTSGEMSSWWYQVVRVWYVDGAD